MKPFKSLDEQISLLQARGLVIDDKDKAKLYLLTNNYYNIINGYGKYFPRNGDAYTNGTNFNEISHLYFFDKEMKQALFQAIINAEVHLKSSFAHRFAEVYGNEPYAYLNISSYDSAKTLSVISTIAKLSNIIDQHRKYNPQSSICHYVKRYKNVPIWVLINFLDFGTLRNMLSSVPTNLQTMVARDMMSFVQEHLPNTTKFPAETMNTFIKNMHEVRNVCAHNNRLVEFSCRGDSDYWAPLHDKYSIHSTDKRRDVFSVFISLQCFLSISEYGTVHNKIRKLIKRLDNKLNTLASDDVLQLLGFPKNWQDTPPIQHDSEHL